MRIKLLLALLLTLGFTTRGQSPVFGVYNAAGNIKYTSSRGGSRPATPHTWLYTADKLILLDNIAEITLFARDSSYIRLHGKGDYPIAEIEKLPRTPIRDSFIIQYFSLFWKESIRSGPTVSGGHPGGGASSTHSPFTPKSLPFVLAPRPSYATSQDSLIFRWHDVSWARKYFLRLRSSDGQLRYDSIVTDTQAIVHFPGRMPYGNSYTWALDIVGESGRLQFADSSHIVLIDEPAVLLQLPPVSADSLGGIAIVLKQIEQYENAGCTKAADDLFQRLTNGFPQDGALDRLYYAFRLRNYF